MAIKILKLQFDQQINCKFGILPNMQQKNSFWWSKIYTFVNTVLSTNKFSNIQQQNSCLVAMNILKLQFEQQVNC